MNDGGRTLRGKYGKSLAENAGIQAAFAILGFLFARTQITGGIYPFGVAVCAACPINSMIFVSAGALTGSLFIGSYFDGARYIAAIAIINIIRYFLIKIKTKNLSVTAMVLSAGSLTAVLIVSAIMISFSFGEIMLYAAEILLSAGSAYFMQRTLKIFLEKESLYNLSKYEMTGLAVVFSIAIVSLSSFEIFSISPARIISVTAILLFALYGRGVSSAVAGIITGFAVSLSASGFLHTAGGYAIGGLVAGIFSGLGGFASAAAFFVANTVTAISGGLSNDVIITIYEVLIASCIFLAIPKQSGRQIVSVFEGPGKIIKTDGFKRGVLMRLDFAGSALSDVSETVEAVAHKLRGMSEPFTDDVFRNVKRDICYECGKYGYCHKQKKKDREKDFKLMEMTLREYGKMEVALLPTAFADECEHKKEFSETAGNYYSRLMLKKSANERIDEFRSIVVDQFKNLSDMLFEMSDSICKSDKSDLAAEEKIYSALKEMGVKPLDVSANIGNSDYMTAEIRIDASRGEPDDERIMYELSRATGRKFNSCSKAAAGNDILISLCEKAELVCDFAVTQHNCDNSALCGDSYGYFTDGRGNAIMILSDGMGSGGRAAVDGAMAAGLMSRLIRAGIGIESAIKIVNSAMLYKSSEESLATLDICCIDLYSGKCDFYKAGAAKSFVVSKNKIIEIESKSVPIGILKDVSFEKSSIKLINGDTVLMFSDGAADVLGSWTDDEIERFDGENLEKLTDIISAKAKVMRRLHDDDITVMALKIKKSVS